MSALAGGPSTDVVVGVDGSEHARRALEWAATEARIRGARLVAVHAWSVPATAYSTLADPFDDGPALERLAVDILRAATNGVARTDVVLEERVRQGPAARVLLHEAAEAALLVVGSRGYGGFTGLLLGSVGQQVVHHTRCPVVVVPHDR
jgi:nucleotide-binding universal stress UspA family protein